MGQLNRHVSKPAEPARWTARRPGHPSRLLGKPGSRKTQIVGGLIGGSVIMFAALAPEAWMALALLAVAYSSLTVAGTGIWSLPADVAPSSKHVGSIGGIQNFASTSPASSPPS